MTNAFDRFRVDGDAPLPEVKDEPKGKPLVEVLARFNGKVLCFDASVSAMGWVLLTSGGGEIIPTWTGCITSEATGIKGWGDYMTRIDDMLPEVVQVFDSTRPDLVVYEAASMGGGLSKPESSLVGSTTVHVVARLRGIPTHGTYAKRAKRHLTGNGNATKPMVRAALLERWPQMKQKRPWNEHVSDAMAVGVTHIETGE